MNFYSCECILEQEKQMNDLLARVIAAHGGLDTKIIAKSGSKIEETLDTPGIRDQAK